MAELVRISKWDRCQPYPMGKDFGAVIDRSGLFGPVERTTVRFAQWLDHTAFVEQVASRSYVQVLPEQRPPGTPRPGRRASAPRWASPIAMPYVTDLFCAQAAG